MYYYNFSCSGTQLTAISIIHTNIILWSNVLRQKIDGLFSLDPSELLTTLFFALIKPQGCEMRTKILSGRTGRWEENDAAKLLFFFLFRSSIYFFGKTQHTHTHTHLNNNISQKNVED